jgi:integrase
MRTSKARPYRNKQRPHLKFVVNFQRNGKRVRSFFTNAKEAATFAQLKNNERMIGETAGAKQLAAFGKTIADAIEFYLPHLQANNRTCTIGALLGELLEAKKQDGLRPRSIQDLRSRLGQFAGTFGTRQVSEIQGFEIEEWLRALGVAPLTRNNFRRVLVTAFNFAQARGYSAQNPAESTAKAKQESPHPGILSVQQAANLLTQADARIVPAVALGLFAGLRPESEGPYLDWSQIDFADKTIEIKKSKRTASERFVTMSDNLIAWLMPHRQNRGAVFPSLKTYRQLLREAQVRAGIKAWPHDGLRHSFGSYHYGTHHSAALTMAEMGHSNPKTFFKHYRRPMKKSAADPFWQITPSADASSKVVSFSDGAIS